MDRGFRAQPGPYVVAQLTTTGYAGQLDFGNLGCRRAVPSLQRLLGFLEEELVELEAA